MEGSLFFILLGIVIFLMMYMGKDGCRKSPEGYANQVVHGTVGGIAGPRMSPSLFIPPVEENVPTLMKSWRAKYPETSSI
ncbi:MAG TPA: hypothetical protein PKD85_01110 [Saprospiraceae bacterium]|nr:hypothetical protein [Saprospiraceae bacterium]